MTAHLDPDTVPDDQVTPVIDDLAKAQRLVEGALTMMARRTTDSVGADPKAKQRAAELLSKTTGTTKAAAKRRLKTSEQLKKQATVADAVRGGELSAGQNDHGAEDSPTDDIDPGCGRVDSPSEGSGNTRRGRRGPLRRSGRQTTVIVNIDIAALRRGRLAEGERCRIEGIGEVSLAAVKALIPDAHLAYVFRDAVDIKSVVHLGRQVTAHQRTAPLAPAAMSAKSRTATRPTCWKSTTPATGRSAITPSSTNSAGSA